MTANALKVPYWHPLLNSGRVVYQVLERNQTGRACATAGDCRPWLPKPGMRRAGGRRREAGSRDSPSGLLGRAAGERPIHPVRQAVDPGSVRPRLAHMRLACCILRMAPI
jgi:hypothetical protein